MDIKEWLAAAQADADRRKLPELKPLLESLASATTVLRAGVKAAKSEDGSHDR